MTGNRRRSNGITAAELAAQLAGDQEFMGAAAAREAERQADVARRQQSERPIIDDLRQVGVDVASVWDLVNTATPYPAALPVLVEHLERGGYPDRVMEGLGRALGVKPAVAYWDRLKALYLASRNPGEEDGTAVALAACARKEHLDDLIKFLSIDERGDSRIYFLRPIKRLGGDRGRQLLESLRDDATFGREASALLSRSTNR